MPFWPDFFALWTHGAVPYDPALAITLLIGTGVVAPSILALGYANYSNRGDLLVRTKGLQLAVFLVLSVLLIPPLGPLGAAIAVVASDLLIQFGLLGLIIIGQTLQRPLRHVAFLAGGDDPRDVGGLGTGNDHPVVGAGDGTDAVCRRVRNLVDDCRAGRKPDGCGKFSQQTDRGNPALVLNRYDGKPACCFQQLFRRR